MTECVLNFSVSDEGCSSTLLPDTSVIVFLSVNTTGDPDRDTTVADGKCLDFV